MFKVIIADDELAVRERLLGQLEKFKDSFKVVGSFDNGYDALVNGVLLQPDLIITDIKMPYIDGIELVKRFKEEMPLIQAIIISGYDSFDFAKQAISLGCVVGYLSKPISFEELKDSMDKAKILLNKLSNFEKDEVITTEEAKKNKELTKLMDLNLLMTTKNISDEFRARLKDDGVNLDYKNLFFCIFDFDEEYDKITINEFENAGLLLEKVVDKEFKYSPYETLFFQSTQHYNLFVMSNDEIKKEEIEAILKKIIAIINKSSKTSMSVGTSEFDDEGGINSDMSFRKLYRHAERTLEFRTVIGKGSVLFYSDLNNTKPQSGKVDDNEFKAISYELLYGHVEQSKNKIAALFEKVTPESFKDTYFFIMDNLLNILVKSCISISNLYDTYMSQADLVKTMYNYKTNDARLAFFNNLVDKIDKINNESKVSRIELSYNQIFYYILNNYTDQTLSLDKLGKDLGYSVSYVSAILKTHNTSFTKCLTDKRMEAAKNLLLSSDEKLVIIASKIGYEDPYYFSHCFKKYYGVSPLTYKKQK